ncbi:hypothetical protein RE6C_02847 [Rhodopirellula europaea 6C]|uniref:Uncharacterized protein n=1 Tax=Rhodopirellula europaea 6C TaxID=1263867 RepID=M2AUX5_9BACT|nr:hypothetical protein RE6C_02847 [Rhodopirellula europaea 6C]
MYKRLTVTLNRVPLAVSFSQMADRIRPRRISWTGRTGDFFD